MEARLFACLSTNDLFKHLSDFVSDPDDTTTKIRQFYVYCRGVKTPARYKIINASLIFFSKSFVQLKFVGMDLSDINLFVKAQYQPNSCARFFRCLFAVFATQDIRFTLAKSFNAAGMFYYYFYVYAYPCFELTPAEYSFLFFLTFLFVGPSFCILKEVFVPGGKGTLVFAVHMMMTSVAL